MKGRKRQQPARISEHRCEDCNRLVEVWGFIARYGPSVVYSHYESSTGKLIYVKPEEIFVCPECAWKRGRQGDYTRQVIGSLGITLVGHRPTRGYLPHRMYRQWGISTRKEKPKKVTTPRKPWKRVKGRQQKLSSRMRG
jgi:hypothetical protein